LYWSIIDGNVLFEVLEKLHGEALALLVDQLPAIVLGL
jgi:hypothetical protein